MAFSVNEPILALGLDPGSRATGWGLVLKRGQRLSLVAAGVVRVPARDDVGSRLAAIQSGVREIIAGHSPLEAAVEGVFAAKNVRSAIKLGQARGVALAACAEAGLPIFEYAPAAVKKALVGNGRAAKEQVRHMVKTLLGAGGSLPLDASDALAIAITHLHSRNMLA